MDLANVLVSEGSFYQCLIGGDILTGKPGVLGPATITMPSPGDQGHIQWKQDKLGCIAYAPFLPPASSVHTTDALPPTPPPSPDLPKTTLSAEGVTLDHSTKTQLIKLAADRDRQLGRNTTTEEWRELFEKAKQLFRDAAFPRNLVSLLTRVFAVRKFQAANCETVLAKVISASRTQGHEAAVQVLESLGIPASPPPR